MNVVVLSGNITKDPEIRYTQSGKAVAMLSLAVTRGWKKAEGSQYPPSDYFNVVAWDRLAEFCNKYLLKGSRILVEGRLQSRSYEKDGIKRYITEVVANDIEFAGSKRNAANGDSSYESNDPAAFLNEDRKRREQEPMNDTNIGTEDVPF